MLFVGLYFERQYEKQRVHIIQATTDNFCCFVHCQKQHITSQQLSNDEIDGKISTPEKLKGEGELLTETKVMLSKH